MSLSTAFAIGASGLADITARLGIVSQNVANASTPGYSREVAATTALTADGAGRGVARAPATLVTDTALAAATLDATATASGLAARQSALAGIDAAQGAPGAGTDIASQLGKMQDSFTALATDPANATQQSAVVGAAATLAAQIRSVAGAIATARQNAQDAMVSDVSTANAALGQIGALSRQIIAARAGGQSTADLENQRAGVLNTLGQILPLRPVALPNGGLRVLTTNGINLPTDAASGPLAVATATLGPASSYPAAGAPAVTLGGVDVTTQLGAGTLGAERTLRDTTLPAQQATLDEFAHTLSTRLDSQGLTLFTAPSGAIPGGTPPPVQAGYVGYSGIITVNPVVAATPALVRDGTHAVAASATGPAAFTPNPPGGPAGFTTLVSRVLNYAFAAQVQAGVAQSSPATTGLGPTGTLAAPFAPPADLAGFATATLAAQAADSATTSADLAIAQGTQTSLQGKLTAETGVSMDQEMSSMITLQTAYGANAKVLTAVQSMWSTLLGMVQ